MMKEPGKVVHTILSNTHRLENMVTLVNELPQLLQYSSLIIQRQNRTIKRGLMEKRISIWYLDPFQFLLPMISFSNTTFVGSLSIHSLT